MTDTERLDFLERHPECDLRHLLSVRGEVVWVCGKIGPSYSYPRKSLREVIDEAMARLEERK